MNWINDMILDLQKKVLGDKQSQAVSQSMASRSNERDAQERLHQFQSRLQDLDRRILELR